MIKMNILIGLLSIVLVFSSVVLLEKYFGKPSGIEDLIEQSNWIQCEGYRASFEEMRKQWPVCSAALNWVYNEPWYTAANNSILVFPATPKPAYYAIKRALRPVLFSARVPKFKWIEGEKFKAEIWLLNDSNQSVVANARVYLKIGDTSINLLENIKTECLSKSNVECATVCCVLPEIPNVGIMTLVIESNVDYSSEYKLKYECKKKIVKPKILNDF
jgi:beta-mannosidase